MSSNSEEEAVASVPGEFHPVTVPRRRALGRLWRAQTIYAVALGAFAVLAVFAYLDPYFSWDLKVSSAFNWKTFAPPGLFPLMRATSVFGNSWTPYALTGLTVILFLLFRRNSEAAGLTLSAGGSGFINTLFKTLIARPRPAPDLIQSYVAPLTNSFPSGHVTFYVTYFGFLFFVAYALLPRGSILRRATLVLTALPVLLIGLSRIYLGAHWPSDTVGAYLWSGVWLAFALWMYRRWKLKRTFHKGEATAKP
ncbi:MAG TPA: phosphatase PAP2 family protein [Pyrinomonadaceae bacterium]|nr:phosphatase PAP2 family protein [Pyrinomonadaceae bacterium]